MAKRASREAKPIEDMLKAELVVELKAKIKEVEMLKGLMLMSPSTVIPRTTRWKTYGRCQT